MAEEVLIDTVQLGCEWPRARIHRVLEHRVLGNTALTSLDVSNSLHEAEDDLAPKLFLDALRSLTTRSSSLRSLDISGNLADLRCTQAVLNFLAVSTCMGTLKMSSCKLTPASCKDILEEIMLNDHMMELDISHNDLDLEALRSLSDMLTWNSWLLSLCVRACFQKASLGVGARLGFQRGCRDARNDLLRSLGTPDPAHARNGIIISDLLGKALDVNDSLQSLDLSGNPLTIWKNGLFANAIQKNMALQTLKVSGCSIGPRGACSLARVLAKNRCLRTVDLSCNKIGNSGARAMGLMLGRNHFLVTLIIRTNEIKPGGAAHIGAALAFNTSLRNLDLMDNSSHAEEDLDAFRRGLSANTTLRTLHIDGLLRLGTNITPVACHRHLVHLSLFVKNVVNTQVHQLSRGLQTHESLRYLNLKFTTRDFLFGDGMTPGAEDPTCMVYRALANNTTLLALKIPHVSNTAEDRALACLLGRNTTLQHLHICGDANYGTHWLRRHVIADSNLAFDHLSALAQNIALESLIIERKSYQDDAHSLKLMLNILADVLRTNTMLTCCDIRHTQNLRRPHRDGRWRAPSVFGLESQSWRAPIIFAPLSQSRRARSFFGLESKCNAQSHRDLRTACVKVCRVLQQHPRRVPFSLKGAPIAEAVLRLGLPESESEPSLEEPLLRPFKTTALSEYSPEEELHIAGTTDTWNLDGEIEVYNMTGGVAAVPHPLWGAHGTELHYDYDIPGTADLWDLAGETGTLDAPETGDAISVHSDFTDWVESNCGFGAMSIPERVSHESVSESESLVAFGWDKSEMEDLADEEVLLRIQTVVLDMFFAFAMGRHQRLGAACPSLQLNDDVMMLIMSQYLGYPIMRYDLQIRLPTGEYALLLEQVEQTLGEDDCV
jgi:Ran GTPase-activating protein (RanGAP) involved in mRNA processing and transport